MMAEVGAVLVLALAGLLVVSGGGLRGLAAVPWALAAGTAAVVAPALVQTVLVLPTSWVLTTALGLAGGVGWWWWQRRRGVAVTPTWSELSVVLGLALVIGLVARPSRLFTWHADSLDYLNVSAMWEQGTFHGGITPYFLSDRLLGVSVLHQAGSLGDGLYAAGVAPFVAVSALALAGWLTYDSVRSSAGRAVAVAAATATVVGLVSINRFVFHAFYINGHLATGLWLLAVLGGAWLLARGRQTGRTAIHATMALSAAAIVVTRPEGLPLMALVIASMVVLAREESTRVVLAGTGFAAMTWHGYAAATAYLRFDQVWTSQIVFAAAGAAALALAATPVAYRWAHGRLALLVVAYGGLWALVGLAALVRPEIVDSSLRATWQNIGDWWPGTLVVLGLALVAVTVFTRGGSQTLLRFAALSFFPLALIMAVARGAAYRVAAPDSLARMWIEVVPVAVVAIVVGLATAPVRSALSRAVPPRVQRPAPH
jgi:hypothetical protein